MVKLSYSKGVCSALKSRYIILLTLFGICTLFYYFGELVNAAGWKALRWELFYTVHDVHRIVFLVPIIFAGWFFEIKGALISTAASLVIFLPRAILISPYPDALARILIFIVAAGLLGSFAGLMSNRYQRLACIQALNGERDNDNVDTPNRIKDGIFSTGDLEVDLANRLVKRRGQIVRLTLTEYELLSYMVRHSGKALTHADLLRNVWGPEYGREYEYLRTFISQLRRKIEDNPAKPKFILTETRVGYRFAEPNRQQQQPPGLD